MENTISPVLDSLTEEDLNKIYAVSGNMIREIEKAVTGKRKEITLLVTALAAGGHVLIEDVPGVGKTTLASALARAAGLSFRRAQFTPDVMASDVTGFSVYNRARETFEFREGLVMTHILLADEINRASPKTQSSLLEAMEEGSVSVDGTTYALPSPFMVIATQNPTGFVGTYPLPEAQLDRFMIRLSLGYPTQEEEVKIILARREQAPMEEIRPVANKGTLLLIRQLCQRVQVKTALAQYMVQLVSATRDDPAFSLGASPRCSLMLMRMSQAYAFMQGRLYVIPEDVSAVLPYTLSHRVVLAKEAALRHETVSDHLADLLRRTPVPFPAKADKN